MSRGAPRRALLLGRARGRGRRPVGGGRRGVQRQAPLRDARGLSRQVFTHLVWLLGEGLNPQTPTTLQSRRRGRVCRPWQHSRRGGAPWGDAPTDCWSEGVANALGTVPVARVARAWLSSWRSFASSRDDISSSATCAQSPPHDHRTRRGGGALETIMQSRHFHRTRAQARKPP